VGSIAAVVVVALLASSCVLNGTWTAVAPLVVSSAYTETRLEDVSCSTPTACLAIGVDNTASGGSTTTNLVQRWDGTSWTAAPVPTFSGATATTLLRVSCGTPTSCGIFAIATIGGVSSHRFAHWDGEAWTVMPIVGINMGGGSGVSCLPSGTCVFVAFGSGVLTWTAGTTSTVSAWSPPMVAFDCTSPTSCFAAISTSNDVYRWDGTDFSPTVVPEPEGLVSGYYDIDCTAADNCLVAGRTWEPYPGTSVEVTAARWDGTSWTVTPVPADGALDLHAISCADAGACVAIGKSRTVGDPPLAFAWNGGQWYSVATPPVIGTYGSYAALSCVPLRCVAVGKAWNGAAYKPLVASYDWTAG
jgi:hypothetical protein